MRRRDLASISMFLTREQVDVVTGTLYEHAIVVELKSV